VIQAPGERKPNRVRAFITNALGALVIGLLGWYLYQNQDILSYLKNINWEQIVFIALLDIAIFLLNSLMNQSMINRLGTRITFLDSYLLQYANNFLNKILPTIGGGAAFRAVYLKLKYQFSYSQFISTVAGIYVISFFSTSLIGLSCLFMIYARFHVFNWVIFLIFLGVCLFCLFIILFSPQIAESDNRIVKVLNSIFEGWRTIKREPKSIFLYALLSIMLLFLSALQTFFSYQALGIKTDLIPMIFLSTLSIILAFLNFTPDGIGVREGVYIFSADLVNIPNDILVLGSLVLRGISICTTFVIGGISYLILTRRLKALEKNNQGLA
jgi:uncharacterized membrane protein YbhN (UPF0104 family)